MALITLQRIAPAFGLAFCILGGLAATGVTRNAPAFSEDRQIDGITGKGRLGYTPAMYQRAEYLFQTAVGFVNADLFSIATTEPPGVIAADDVVRARLGTASDLLVMALQEDPSDAHKWFVYAQTAGALGNFPDSLAALTKSYDLGPTMPRLAYQRIWLRWALTLSNPQQMEGLRDREDIADRDVIKTRSPGLWKNLPDTR